MTEQQEIYEYDLFSYCLKRMMIRQTFKLLDGDVVGCSALYIVHNRHNQTVTKYEDFAQAYNDTFSNFVPVPIVGSAKPDSLQSFKLRKSRRVDSATVEAGNRAG